MLIGIISDTHDDIPSLLEAVKEFNRRKVDFVVHCGDWVSPFMIEIFNGLNCKVISVFGNNEGDVFRIMKKKGNVKFHDKVAELKFGNKNIIVYHGDSKSLLDCIVDSEKYDAVFSGHTHISIIERKGKTLHINPGAASGICGSETTGKKTIAVYSTEKDEGEIIKLK